MKILKGNSYFAFDRYTNIGRLNIDIDQRSIHMTKYSNIENNITIIIAFRQFKINSIELIIDYLIIHRGEESLLRFIAIQWTTIITDVLTNRFWFRFCS